MWNMICLPVSFALGVILGAFIYRKAFIDSAQLRWDASVGAPPKEGSSTEQEETE